MEPEGLSGLLIKSNLSAISFNMMGYVKYLIPLSFNFLGLKFSSSLSSNTSLTWV